MGARPEVRLSTQLQRKDPRLPVYVVIPGRHVQAWRLTGTTVIEGTANGHPFGRRTIKAWGKGTDDWFVEFTAPFCKTARLNVAGRVVLELRLADSSAPKELESLLSKSKGLAAAWLAVSERWRRDAGEHIRAAEAQATRERRAALIAELLRGRAKKRKLRKKGAVALLSGGNPQIAKADGDAPVQAYIAAMPGWKHDVGRRLDALVARTVPKVRKAVKWNSPFYGIEGRGWFLSFHVFTRYVKVTFFQGASLSPVPPGPSKHKDVRYFDVHEDELFDEAQMAAWIRQAVALPGWVP